MYIHPGLFAKSNLPFEQQRNKDPDGTPSLQDLTKKAIQILQKNEEGFFLLVESKCLILIFFSDLVFFTEDL